MTAIELMTLAREKLEQIRTRPGTLALAERWQAGMDTQVAGAGEARSN